MSVSDTPSTSTSQVSRSAGDAWDPEMREVAVIRKTSPVVEIDGVRHLELCDGVLQHRFATRQLDPSQLLSVDFIVVPFRISSGLAHTMISFGFEGGQYITVSVEARRRLGQRYSALRGLFGKFPLAYVVSEERDAIGLRCIGRKDQVYLFRASANSEDAQALFLDMVDRIQRLANSGEAYNTLWNNCLTNIRMHVNRVWPGSVPWNWRLVFTGHAAVLAHKLGMLDSGESYQEIEDRAEISKVAIEHIDAPDFSRRIRQCAYGAASGSRCAGND